MRLIMGLIGAVIGGMVGAGLWAFVAFEAHREIGWIAWGVGVLAGIGARSGSKAQGGPLMGGLAVLVAIVAIVAGKYGAATLVVDDLVSKHADVTGMQITDEQEQATIALALVPEYQQQGKPLVWPTGGGAGSAHKPAEFPPNLWADAQARWKRLTPDQHQDYKDATRERFKVAVVEFKQRVTDDAFAGSFGLFDLLFGFLAIGSAFKIGAGGSVGES